MALTRDDGSAVDGRPDLPLVPVHPESVPGDERTLRWSCPADILGFVGVPAQLPTVVQSLVDDGVLDCVSVEPAAIQTTLGAAGSWRQDGARVRQALQTALSTPRRWRPAPGGIPGDDALTLAVRQVIDGEVGDYIRSHGGHVELLNAHDDDVLLQLSGACSHCPASDLTLTERLEAGIRARYPQLRRLEARSGSGMSAGRRMLALIPTRGR